MLNPQVQSWVQGVSLGGILAALGLMIRIAGNVSVIRFKVETMWESWLVEHSHVAATPANQRRAAKAVTPRASG
jgi:hypothetical protein